MSFFVKNPGAITGMAYLGTSRGAAYKRAMQDIIPSILSGGPYAWLAAALIMIASEIAVPSNWLLWPGIAAFITSIILYFVPDLPWTGAGVIFVILSMLLLYVGRRYVKLATRPIGTPNPNARSARMVGRRGSATRDGPDGVSHIQIDGVEWPVRSADNAPLKTGDALEVIAVAGATLLVKPLKMN